MKVRRVISAYSTINDKLLEEFEINNIPIIELRKILNVEDDDLEVYKVYSISSELLLKFISFIPELSDINLNDVALYIESFQD